MSREPDTGILQNVLAKVLVEFKDVCVGGALGRRFPIVGAGARAARPLGRLDLAHRIGVAAELGEIVGELVTRASA